MDAIEVKTAAAGRWREILPAMGIPAECLTGKNCPCPKCGGTDRFAAFADVDQTGGLNCRKCGSNADGLAAVQWWTGESFPAAIKLVADYLGLNGSPNGHHAGNGKAKADGGKGEPAYYSSAVEATESLQRTRGEPSAAWHYQDASGATVGYTLRWDKAGGGKDILPISLRRDGWVVGAMLSPRPLYRLGDLVAAERVYICEGEKAADAARSCGLTATTSSGGCGAWDSQKRLS